MRYRWLMPIVAIAVMSQSPEEQLARKLDHEAQFQLRLARPDAARQKLRIAEWLSPNINRHILLQVHTHKKGIPHDSH